MEIWDADDFDPWESLQWETVRVLRYRQHKPDDGVVEAYWLTDLSSRRISRRCLYHMAKSRWHIENEGFNDAKNRYGLEHIRHHHERSLLIVWLLTCLALTLERLYRLLLSASRFTSRPRGYQSVPPSPPHLVSAGRRRFQLRAAQSLRFGFLPEFFHTHGNGAGQVCAGRQIRAAKIGCDRQARPLSRPSPAKTAV